MALKKRNAFVDDPLWETFTGAIPPGVTKTAAWAAAMYAFALASPSERLRLLGFVAEWQKAAAKDRAAILRRHVLELSRRPDDELARLREARRDMQRRLKQDPESRQAAALEQIAKALMDLTKQGAIESASDQAGQAQTDQVGPLHPRPPETG